MEVNLFDVWNEMENSNEWTAMEGKRGWALVFFDWFVGYGPPAAKATSQEKRRAAPFNFLSLFN